MNDQHRFDRLSDAQLQELNLICDTYEKALRAGESGNIEEQLAKAPADIRRELFLELLEMEIEALAKFGAVPSAAEYEGRFPDQGDEIRQAIDKVLSSLPGEQNATVDMVDSGDQESAPTAHPSGIRKGVQIGPYQLLQPIGEGGMGSVWMAEQASPVRRTVALKIIKTGLDSREVIARFEAERQALALMNHPNIARFLDIGETDEGRPYFVMELVKGVPITTYCDSKRLGSTRRLRLFTAVCRAVQHAHQKGVIHRDIKPSNVLVSESDGEPVVKVIDFGLAKAIGQSLANESILTAFGQLIGTPAYMSPEQADGGLDIDTRTDVYSLGVLLYELLTGVTPLDHSKIRAKGFAELLKMIRDESPPPMSHRISSLGGDSQVIASNRATDLKRLVQTLRGDLDLIVMKALDKERNRRYETASGFAADVDRFLKHEAIVARPASATYRLRKLIRRNKTAVLAVTCVALALLVGTLVSAWQAMVAIDQRNLAQQAQQREAKQRQAADEQRDRARLAETQEKQRANELQLVTDFQAEMLSQIDTYLAGQYLSDDIIRRFTESLTRDGLSGEEFSRQLDNFQNAWKRINTTDAALGLIDHTILTPGVAAIDKQFKDQPIVDAKLRQTLANLYRDLGLYQAAMPLQTDALTIRRRVLGERNADTLYSITNMGVLLQTQGNLNEAEPYYHESLDKRRELLGKEHPDTLVSLNNMGFLLQSQGEYDEAETYYRQTLAIRRRVLGENDEMTIASLSNLGFLLRSQGKFEEAEPYFIDSLKGSRQFLGEEHPSTLTAINNLGELLVSLKRLDEAEALQLEALEKRRRILGEEHSDTINSLNNLGVLKVKQGKTEEALPYLREALEKRRRNLGNAHPSTLTSINNMGAILVMLGRLDEAEPFLAEALDNRRSQLGAEHPSTLSSIAGLGNLLLRQRKLAAAEPLFRSLLEKTTRLRGREHASTLTAMSQLGTTLLLQGRLDEAEPVLQEALDNRRRILGEDDEDTVFSIILWGSLLLAQGQEAEAISVLSPIGEAPGDAFDGPNAYRRGQLFLALGNARAATAEDATDWNVAEANLLEAHKIYVATPSPAPQDLIDCVGALVQFYSAWHEVEPAAGHDASSRDWKTKLEPSMPPSN